MYQRLKYYAGNPNELGLLLQMKKEYKRFRPSGERLTILSTQLNDYDFCFEALKKVSRSFSVVIHQLPKELQAPVGVFYLILRGLDTVEDDMSLPQEQKTILLNDFADRINREAFTLENVGDTQDYRDLMANFDKVVREFQLLDSKYREVITDITRRMAFGMNKYVHETVETYDDWDDYCHYVAGLVGIGLSKLFVASGLENAEQLKDEKLSNEMGLFLQKTNIIRDFAEDLEQTRVFWPSKVWGKKAASLHEIQQNQKLGLEVMNELIVNALKEASSCMEYMKSIKDKQIFRFCAIPQLMAMATLEKLYNNAKVLSENVKIRKGKTARFFMSEQHFESVKKEFITLLNQIYKKDKNSNVKQIMDSLYAY